MTHEDLLGPSEDGAVSPVSPRAGMLAERLRQIRAVGGSERRTVDLKALQALVKSGEIRDWPFCSEFYAEFFSFQASALSWGRGAQVDTELARQIFLGVVKVPEFDAKAAQAHVADDLILALASTTDGTHPPEEWPYLRDLLLWVYEHSVARRAQVRSLVGRTLRAFSKFSHRNVPVAVLLQVLAPIVRGFPAPLAAEHKSLLLEVLLPLHRPNEWLQWDRQTPLLSMYHKELVHCIKLYLEKQPSLCVRCVEVICTHFPQDREANTPKEVLLLHEISQVLSFADQAGLRQILPPLLRQMVRLLGSHNAQPIQSVLQFWKDDHIAELFRGASEQLIPQLLPVLLRSGEPFWNPTVNRMTSLVLEKLEASNAELFEQIAEELWGPGRGVPAFELAAAAEPRRVAEEREEAAEAAGPRRPPPAPNAASLKYRMGGWKPPTGPGDRGSGPQPPLTVTGVAPWAMDGGGASLRPGPLTAMQGAGAGPKQPPLTTTGVAPWAMQGGPLKAGPLPAGLGPGAVGRRPPQKSSLGAFKEEDEEKGEDAIGDGKFKSGIERVHAYMKVLCPQVTQETASGMPWEAAQMAESPTLLPTLKFHQLVFGHEDLGTGAFSVVRYARTIDKEKTQSHWAEYAVKVIDTKTMEDLGYEASVNREICILRTLSHPGIARMVSSFRWRNGAYLVLEYAARGDLHGILVRLGKLEEATVRFFLGETIAALSAIHEVGFVYGDLKPENVVVTASCHAKLTDFGGCRPLTAEARETTRRSLLRSLRDGDWRAAGGGQPAEAAQEAGGAGQVDDDGRVEGTTLYLPPEVVRGGAPTFAADAWALGCMECQLLSGRPPIWAESEREEDLRSRIVSFRFESQDGALESLSETARGLASRLMEQDAAQRASIAAAAGDAFFEGMDVFTLYRRPRGPDLPKFDKAAPAGDERWQKRQFSKIWTVMPSPQDYVLPDTFGDQGTCARIAETGTERGAPFGEDGWGPLARDTPQIESL